MGPNIPYCSGRETEILTGWPLKPAGNQVPRDRVERWSVATLSRELGLSGPTRQVCFKINSHKWLNTTRSNIVSVHTHTLPLKIPWQYRSKWNFTENTCATWQKKKNHRLDIILKIAMHLLGGNELRYIYRQYLGSTMQWLITVAKSTQSN